MPTAVCVCVLDWGCQLTLQVPSTNNRLCIDCDIWNRLNSKPPVAYWRMSIGMVSRSSLPEVSQLYPASLQVDQPCTARGAISTGSLNCSHLKSSIRNTHGAFRRQFLARCAVPNINRWCRTIELPAELYRQAVWNRCRLVNNTFTCCFTVRCCLTIQSLQPQLVQIPSFKTICCEVNRVSGATIKGQE